MKDLLQVASTYMVKIRENIMNGKPSEIFHYAEMMSKETGETYNNCKEILSFLYNGG